MECQSIYKVEDRESIECSGFSPMRNEPDVDYQDVFHTMDLFDSREALISWVRERALPLGIVVVVFRSELGTERRLPRLWLACERSGVYRPSKKKPSKDGDEKKVEGIEEGGGGVVENVSKKSSKNKRTVTKKCECPFRLKCTQYPETGKWALKVACSSHNHETTQYLQGHSYVGRLTSDEEKLVADLSMSINSRPKEILFTLQKRYTDNKSNIKTIYNIRHKHRHVERAGRSQMQYLLVKLKEIGFFCHTRRCKQTDTVKDLFFAHPTSVQFLRSFPHVLLMDCAYKTNGYNLPLLEIMGVTSTNMIFSVACAYMESEKEESYVWVCTVLKGLMDKGALPTVFVTDNEPALMIAIKRTFPSSNHLLCRWHINMNIMAHCKNKFRNKEEWNSFYLSWSALVVAPTEHSFEELLRRFKEDFECEPDVVEYVVDNWITPYKTRFVSCWTNKVMHFDNTTTNRAESQHSQLKRQLGSSTDNFETCWTRIYTLLETSYNAIKSSFEKSVNIDQYQYELLIFKLLRGSVSIVALDMIFNEMTVVNKFGIRVDPLLCGCILRKKCGLPCAHEIAEYLRVNIPIPLESVDKFWRKLDMEPVKGEVINIGADLKSQYEKAKERIDDIFATANESKKLWIVKKLKEIVEGAKSKQEKSTKRNPRAFEYVNSIRDSCSSVDNMLVVSGPTTSQPISSSTQRKKQKIIRQSSLSHDTSQDAEKIID